MSNYQLLRKMTLSVPKNYTRQFLLTRINTFFAFGQLTEAEYTDLMNLLNEHYPETA